MNGRSFEDGGIGYNNPSYVIFDHYIKANLASQSRRSSMVTETTIPLASHGDFIFSRVRLINLGTGTKPGNPEAPVSGGLANFMPGVLRMALFLKSALKNIAVDSETTAGIMTGLASTNNYFKYVRFSADNGVCFIELDKFKELGEIERLTSAYLETPTVRRRMERVAGDIAKDYLENERPAAAPLQPDRLNVPESTPRPQTPVSQTGPRSRRSSDTQASTGQSRDHSESSAHNTPPKESNSAETEATTPGSERRSESRSRWNN
jgi:hypothetical protein